jgi:valyl-tRNA synthetase
MAPGAAYAVMMPPPNVTGSLHMGHALNNVLQDVLVRYKKMDGHNVVWVPGVDHASIAVHWVLERQLQKEKTSRQKLGREKFMQRAWAFKEQTQDAIVAQQRRLGIAADWPRQRFTMDEGLTKAVRAAFVALYRDGLIYRAERLVNWDPVSQTSVSDLEVVYDDQVKGELYHFAYRLSDGTGEVVVATTRPETMLGDTALAVHPDDARFKSLVGKTVQHPLLDNVHLPIVADAVLVDPAFGSGVVKITPGHSFDDFEVGLRHRLPVKNILCKDGTLNASCGEFAGLSVLAARRALKEKLESLGLERGCEPHKMRVGRSERSGAVLEPTLSTQWYVRTKPLRTPALAAVRQGFTKFVPNNWQNTYFSWLVDIRDWCISRQLWWGHRIPAWHCNACAHITVDTESVSACAACESLDVRQEDDILDTWFSSALWPFATLGWPEQSAELQRYYPTAVLITGFDIIFFWVARMMMFGLYFTGQVPFKDVYIHALIRDAEGDKMSKSKGNVINPLAMIDTYGVDAFRFTLAAFAGHGRDVRWDEQRASGYQKFVNKLWQAFRFTYSHLPPDRLQPADLQAMQAAPRTLYDRWILARLGACTQAVREALDAYRFSDAAAAVYAFVWDEFCDWYLEISKTVLYAEFEGGADAAANAALKDASRATLLQVFSGISRVVAPFMPFLAEELWQRLATLSAEPTVPDAALCSSVMAQRYPSAAEFPGDAQATFEVGSVTRVVTALRRVRAEYNVLPRQSIEVLCHLSPQQQAHLQGHLAVVQALSRATLRPGPAALPPQTAVVVVDGGELWIPLAGLVDLQAETVRLGKEIDKVDKDRLRLEAQLGSASFVDRAPAEIVAEKRLALQEAHTLRQRLEAALARLS